MATPGSLAISSLHRLQKIVCVISNGYPGTRSKLIRVPGRHFTTFLTPLLLIIAIIALYLTSIEFCARLT